MSNDTHKEIKSTESSSHSDKRKRKRVEESNDTLVGDDGKEDMTEKKRLKKEKKEKRRKEKEAVSLLDAPAAEQTATLPASEQPAIEDKKRKRKHEDAVVSPTDRTKHKSEKKKKRPKVSEDADIPHTSTDVASPNTPDHPSDTEVSSFLSKNSITIHAGSATVTPILNFNQLPIRQDLLNAFSSKFKEPTPIQACAWPPALQGRDLVGIAETGSGKTLAFGIPALSRLLSDSPRGPGVTTLIVAPTRELAVQTHDNLSVLGEEFGIGSVAVFGGVPKEGQIKLLKKVQNTKDPKGIVTRIIVGTPGRILDLVNDGACDLSGIDYLVLDEADRMLDKGFENDIRRIISFTKQGTARQTMMFSATWPEAVRRLASTFQQDPVRVTVGSEDLTANSRVEQTVDVFDDARSKDSRLFSLLRNLVPKSSKGKGSAKSEVDRILVFALYKKEASRVEQALARQGYTVGALHGDLSQSARLEALERFKTGETPLLVATDVAARGLDIPNVTAVINYTFPLTIEDYVHRIGRTGRGGRSGKSITFFTGEAHERALAGEFARVLQDGGFDSQCDELRKRFPMTIKKKTHSVYGAFFRDDIPAPKGPTKIVF
ncbi:hypothetical protein HGRIS_007286 [Hohenbuehelia grisea]|uniref:RNA helicase n=1 Tax=Hohenbuehelia grisea TaxID=104357 RepID=A0ABR3J498_9AGAR